MFQAVIFDFDGVLLDSEPMHYEASSYVIKKLGLSLSFDEYEEKYLGLADRDMFTRFFTDYGREVSSQELQGMIAEKGAFYTNLIYNHDKLPMMEDVDKYIEFLLKQKLKLGICTGSTRNELTAALACLKQGALQSCFNTSVTVDDISQGKPSPEGYLLTAKRLGVLPEKCMVIEDAPHGVEAAKAAGMFVTALLTTYPKERLQQADLVVNNFAQLMMMADSLK